MKESVIIKSASNGISLKLNENIPFSELLYDLKNKFIENKDFLKDCKVALSFEGRKIDDKEQEAIVDIIHDTTDVNVVCIIDDSPQMRQKYEEYLKVQQGVDPVQTLSSEVHTGTLRSGQSVFSPTNLVVLGDVNPGATVEANGSIFILGALKGTALAGRKGDITSVVVALDMQPMQIHIGHVIARSPDGPLHKELITKIAYIDNNNIYIEPLTKEVLNEIRVK